MPKLTHHTLVSTGLWLQVHPSFLEDPPSWKSCSFISSSFPTFQADIYCTHLPFTCSREQKQPFNHEVKLWHSRRRNGPISIIMSFSWNVAVGLICYKTSSSKYFLNNTCWLCLKDWVCWNHYSSFHYPPITPTHRNRWLSSRPTDPI